MVWKSFAGILVCTIGLGCGTPGVRWHFRDLDTASRAHAPGPGGKATRERLREDAIRGLRFDDGRVRIDRHEAAQLSVVPGTTSVAVILERGEVLLEQGRVNAAIRHFVRAILSDETRARAYDGLGRAMLVEREFDRAESAFRTALAHAGAHEVVRDLHFHLATTLDRANRSAAAIEAYETLLAQGDDRVEAHVRLAALYYQDGRPADARRALERAQALGGEAPPQLATLLNGGVPRADVRPPSQVAGSPAIGPPLPASAGWLATEIIAASSDADPDVIAIGFNEHSNPTVQCAFTLSFDGGTTWDDFLFPPPPGFVDFGRGDPMSAFDRTTGDLWIGATSWGRDGGVYVARLPAGQTELEATVAVAPSIEFADRGTMVAGPAPGGASTNLYIAQREGLHVSNDLGATWNAPVPLPFGIPFVPRVGPDGTLYVSYRDGGTGVKLLRSVDGGQTLGAPIHVATLMDIVENSVLPGNFRASPLPALAVDPNDGTLYLTYSDVTGVSGPNSNVDIYFTKSDDQGSTWTPPVIINSDNAINPADQFFAVLEVDQSGRLHMVFYDTRSVIQNDNQHPAFIETYYSFSDDGGMTWQETVLSDQAFSTAAAPTSGTFIGDYVGLAVAGNHAYPSYMSTHEGSPRAYMHVVTHAPTAPPPISDGTGGGDPLEVERLAPDGTQLRVSWDDGCSPVTAKILYGTLGDVATYGVDGAECGIGQPHTWAPVPAGDLWFVVVPEDGADTEGSWGLATPSNERNGLTASATCGSTSKDVSGACP